MNQQNRLSVVIGVLSLLLGLLFAVTLEANRVARGGASTWLPAVGDSPVVTMAIYDNVVLVVGFTGMAVGYLPTIVRGTNQSPGRTGADEDSNTLSSLSR